MASQKDFERALALGRPPTIARLFPHSKALIVSGKVIDRAMIKKGKAMTIAANARNSIVIRGVLQAAQRANAAIILEIAKSEAGYCLINMWNLARYADTICNELGITVPVAIHADHFGLKKQPEVAKAHTDIPSMFDAGITSIAIDASHMPDDLNLMANLELSRHIPAWAGYETEVGEIKGKEGLSTPEEALFLIRGLNAHGVFPDWIALNNGTTHGIEATDSGIDVDLTRRIHEALAPYGISGAQHGTSGNHYERLKRIAEETRTTKANVATALQMISWGVKVNEFGNAVLDADKNFIKLSDQGVTDELWAEMVAYAQSKSLKAGDYKNLNLPFENKLLAQPREIRERMAKGVEDFVYDLLVKWFNASDTADLAIEAILEKGSYDMGPKASRIEDPSEWTKEKIAEKAARLGKRQASGGNFDD
ncbi:MAG TPA: class II fructose-bisphosphate aldolase [Deltaproteobacteria bacterium]|nr:class II fructose-bisphosphate aldolase [Deltaproteobacteria bacterium]HOM29562.1 class II fructose-bisphosphate aldolase [Deltaproteobacteria bacterium]HPP81108.1 class II fructose-bisphosphate aldolase [Deltaproteobacteria bacterium]